MSSVVVFEAAM